MNLNDLTLVGLAVLWTLLVAISFYVGYSGGEDSPDDSHHA